MTIEIENDALDPVSVRSLDRLTASKIRSLETLTRSRDALLDYGAGSGKFLYFCRTYFSRVLGVEVTPSCIAFAREWLDVSLVPQIPEGSRFDVITAWHVLEHLPPSQLAAVARGLHGAAEEALLISVPNAGSWASAWFGSRYPYRDTASHFHEFSPRSLELLLRQSGWTRVYRFRMVVYSVFCYAQGLTNVVTRSHNLLYYRVKRGQSNGTLTSVGLALHAVLFALCSPMAMLLTMLEIMFPEKGACLNVVCYRNERP